MDLFFQSGVTTYTQPNLTLAIAIIGMYKKNKPTKKP